MRRDARTTFRPHPERGLTLVEVLVALAVVAVSLMAAGRAFSQWVYGSQYLHERMLASICAQNTLTAWHLSRTVPSVGVATERCVQDGLAFEVRTDVNTTPNPTFRRATIDVRGPSSPDAVLFTIATAIAKP